MNARDQRRTALVAACAAALVMLETGACVLAAETYTSREERRFSVTGTPDISATTFDGSVDVRGWDRNEVVVEIERRGRTKGEADRVEVKTSQEGSRIVIEVVKPKGERGWFGIGDRAWANLHISAPRKVSLFASSGDGSIRAEDLAGRIELRTGDGSVHGQGLTGDLRIHTGDGSVRVDKVAGTADVDTGDGSITLAGTPGVLRARTGDGHVTVRVEPGTRLAGDWALTSGDGGITLSLPDDVGAEIDAHTGDGHISTDFPITVQGRVGGQDLRARLGQGGPQIRVRTGDGSIALRKS